MRFSTLLVPTLLALLASSAPCEPAPSTSAALAAPSTVSTATTGGVNPALVLDFGANPNPNPDGHGNCDGAVKDSTGAFIKVPCGCPPSRDLFIADLNANVAVGHCVNNTAVGVSFPESTSTADQITRLQGMLATLQNLEGTGVGCPASSTDWSALLKALTG